MSEPFLDEQTKISFADLFGSVGLALHQWAQVEESMFELFDSILRAPSEELASIVFYSSPSFESKKVLIERVAQSVLARDEMALWSPISKKLTEAGEFRGRIAHYGIEYKVLNSTEVTAAILKGEEPTFVFDGPFLRRSKKNKLPISANAKNKELINKTTLADIMKFIRIFSELSTDIAALTEVIRLAHPHPVLQGVKIAQGLGQLPTKPDE